MKQFATLTLLILFFTTAHGQKIIKNKNGVFNGKRIISEKRDKLMTEKRHKIKDFSNVRISKNKTAIPQPTYYAYTWYNEEIKTKKFKHNIIFASGNGG